MPGLHQSLELQGLLEEVAERIKDNPQGRSYLSLDGLAYVLAVGGENAMAMHDFMMAVGRYLVKVKHTPRADKETAKAELIRSFEEWLSKQTI